MPLLKFLKISLPWDLWHKMSYLRLNYSLFFVFSMVQKATWLYFMWYSVPWDPICNCVIPHLEIILAKNHHLPSTKVFLPNLKKLSLVWIQFLRDRFTKRGHRGTIQNWQKNIQQLPIDVNLISLISLIPKCNNIHVFVLIHSFFYIFGNLIIVKILCKLIN